MNSGDIVGGEQGPAAQSEVVHHGDEEFTGAPTEVPPEEVVSSDPLYVDGTGVNVSEQFTAAFETNLQEESPGFTGFTIRR